MFKHAHFPSMTILVASVGAILSPSLALGDLQPEIYWYIGGTMERIAIDGTQRETLISNIPDGWGLDVSVESNAPISMAARWKLLPPGWASQMTLSSTTRLIISTGPTPTSTRSSAPTSMARISWTSSLALAL
jgi:hypothetical protein